MRRCSFVLAPFHESYKQIQLIARLYRVWLACKHKHAHTHAHNTTHTQSNPQWLRCGLAC